MDFNVVDNEWCGRALVLEVLRYAHDVEGGICDVGVSEYFLVKGYLGCVALG